MEDNGRRADNSPSETSGNRFGSKGIVSMCVNMGAIESLENAGSGSVIREMISGRAGAFFFSIG